MILDIELKPSDAIGEGAKILEQLGARALGQNIWSLSISIDPALYDDYTQVMPIMDKLLSVGVKPVRSSLRVEGLKGTPMSASAAARGEEPVPQAVAREWANSLRRTVLKASAEELTPEASKQLLFIARAIEEEHGIR